MLIRIEKNNMPSQHVKYFEGKNNEVAVELEMGLSLVSKFFGRGGWS